MFCTVLTSKMLQRLTSCTLWLLLLLPLLMPSLPHTSAQIVDSIFPTDYLGYGNGYSNFRSKRYFGDSSSHCSHCISTYDRESCLRCWNSKAFVVPFHAKKRGVDLDELSAEDFETEKRNYEPLVRYQRGSGCGCCYLSRFSNRHCCRVCSLASKRTGKRSGDLLTSDLLMRSPSPQEQQPPSKRAYMINPDCFCCYRNGGYGGEACCARCFAK